MNPDPETVLASDPFVRRLARAILRDAHDAEDAAQDAWTLWLERGPRIATAWRGWFAGVLRRLSLRRHRTERNRKSRELAAARPESDASAEQILAREATRKLVIDAVLALEPGDREVLALRFFDGLPPRAIARRLELPVETVRSRTKRALERLRLDLLRRHAGDPGALAVMLVDLGRGARAVTYLSTSAILMGKAHVASVGLLLAVVLIVAWQQLPTTPAAPIAADPGTNAAAAASLSASVRTGLGESRTPASGPSRESPPPAGGTLEVEVVWARDGSPAADVAIEVSHDPIDVFALPEREKRSDAQGHARFTGLGSGSFVVRSDRGTSEKVAIDEAHGALLQLALPSSVDLEGIVVAPDGTPVADAEILGFWMQSQARNGLLTRTGADGRFRVRDIRRGSLVEARAAGHATSARYRLGYASPEATAQSLRILLGPDASELRVKVVDGRGLPVAGAAVIVGYIGSSYRVAKLEDGSWGEPARGGTFRTDRYGLVHAAGLPPGRHEVLALGSSGALWRGAVNLRPDSPTELAISLAEPARIAGTVRAADGSPVEGAEVRVEPFEWFRDRRSKSDAAGRFTLTGLEPGMHECIAVHADKGRDGTKLVVMAGSEEAWNPVLAPGHLLKGSVRDPKGAPRAGFRIEIDDQHHADTDAAGHFRIRNVPGERVTVLVKAKGSEQPLLVRAGVAVPSPPMDLVVADDALPSVTVRGRVVLREGGVPEHILVTAFDLVSLHGHALPVDAENGEFQSGPLLPGSLRLWIQAHGCGATSVRERKLRPGETWDVGVVELEHPGTLDLDLRRADGAPLDDERIVKFWDRERGHVEWQLPHGGKLRPASLAPGRYRVLYAGPGLAALQAVVEIRSGETTRATAIVQQGVAAPVRFVLPEKEPGPIEAVVLDMDGLERARELVHRDRESGESRWALGLAPGTYSVTASTASGRNGAATLVVPPAGLAEPARCELR